MAFLHDFPHFVGVGLLLAPLQASIEIALPLEINIVEIVHLFTWLIIIELIKSFLFAGKKGNNFIDDAWPDLEDAVKVLGWQLSSS
jgi:hypothetical protein